MKVTVLLPSKGRPTKLLRCIASIPQWASVAIHATCAEDVPEALLSRPSLNVSFGSETVVASFNHLAAKAGGHVVPFSDDAEFLPGGLEAACELLKQQSENALVGLTVGNMRCSDTAFVLVANSLLRARGHLYHPEFEHFFSDTELGEWAKQRGLFYTCQTEGVLNHHPQVSGDYDHTHRHRRMEKWQHDKAVYDRLKGSARAPAPAIPQT